MRKGGVLIAVLLLMCISVLVFFLFASSVTRNYDLSKSRSRAGKAYYNTEAVLRSLDTEGDQKIVKILAENMSGYTGSFKRMKLGKTGGFSDDYTFYLYPDMDSSTLRHLLDVEYHHRSDGIHCELTGAFSFENPSFFSKVGYLDSEILPKNYDDVRDFIEDCCKDWTEYSQAIRPDKSLKDLPAASVIRIYQKAGNGYHLCKFMGEEGEHSCGLEDFDALCSLNTAGTDSKFTGNETKTDVYLEGVANGFPRREPTVLFGTYVVDGDLYVRTKSHIYGILIMKNGKIFCSEGAELNIHGLLISAMPFEEGSGCKTEFDAKYMLREAVTLPNFLDVRLIGIRE